MQNYLNSIIGGGGQNPLTLYYYKNVYNLGDMLNLELCQRIFHLKPTYCDDFTQNKACFIGSILQNFIQETPTPITSDIPLRIWGSGILVPPKPKEYFTREVEIYALRGKLSKQRLENILGKPLEVALGDPGLLANLLIQKSFQPRYDVGIIPHYIEKKQENFKRILEAIPNSILIDVQAPCMESLVRISECKTVLSSAMHGLILADGLGIPNLRIKASKHLAETTNYKFLDYYSVYNISPFVFDIQTQEGLEEVLKRHKTMPNFIYEHYQIPQDKVLQIKKNLISAFPYLPPSYFKKFWFKASLFHHCEIPH